MSDKPSAISETLSWSVPANFEAHSREMLSLAKQLSGYLSEKEIRFLCQLALVPESMGAFLEIGSFRGKSTIILGKSLELMCCTKMHAVDPLCPDFMLFKNAGTEKTPRETFDENLAAHNVTHLVEFHQMPSQELAQSWNEPLRVLWIDGDHSYESTRIDFDCFAKHLVPGGIIAFHDVLHGFEGPVRVFLEQVVLSHEFGFCGLTGSIGWAQYLGDSPLSDELIQHKQSLAKQLNRLVPMVSLGRVPKYGLDRLKYKMLTSLIPHAVHQPESWVEQLKRAG